MQTLVTSRGSGGRFRLRCLLGGGVAATWGNGDPVLYLALGASFLFLTRTSEMFALTQSRAHPEYGLWRGDVSFFCGPRQLHAGQWVIDDRVEVRFRISKGDSFEKVK